MKIISLVDGNNLGEHPIEENRIPGFPGVHIRFRPDGLLRHLIYYHFTLASWKIIGTCRYRVSPSYPSRKKKSTCSKGIGKQDIY